MEESVTNRILFLSRWFPYPPSNGSKLRIFNLIKSLADVAAVDLITFHTEEDLVAAKNELSQWCQNITSVPYQKYQPNSLKAILGLFLPSPRFITYTHKAEMEAAIRDAALSGQYEMIIASQWEMASYWKAFGQVPSIFEEVELGAFLGQREEAGTELLKARHSLTLMKLKAYAQRIIPNFSACTVVSELELEKLSQFVPGYDRIFVIPNCIRVSDYQVDPTEEIGTSMIFTGSMEFEPNYQGMRWFCKHIYPRILEVIPDARLIITGKGKDRELPNIGRIERTGFVEDVRPLLASAKIALAPIWSGGGTRLKILEAMALKTPVVATSKGAEGLGVRDGEEILIADQPQAFANQVIRLLQDRHLRHRLAQKGYLFVSTDADCSVVGGRLIEVCSKILSNSQSC